MLILWGLLRPLQLFNDSVLPIARWLAVLAMALMVLVTLTQVFFRYVLNDALPWPDEAARFFMLWMTGLIAPTAYRIGGFVAIDMLEQALPRAVGGVLGIFLFAVSLLVLLFALRLGWNHVNSGWLFASSSLRLPLDLIGMETIRIKLAWMYMSLFVGIVLLTIVNLELLIRALITVGGRGDELAPISGPAIGGAE